jgi:pimeloyl-ACP methyl ester carboxylesterase
VRDLRGVFRATLCERPEMAGARCERTLQRLAGEEGAAPAPRARAGMHRLVFVGGLFSDCLAEPGTFADVTKAASDAGFAVTAPPIGGRSSVAANAAALASALQALPDDGRHVIVVAHSKGAVDALEVLARRPDLASRVAAVLTIAAPLGGTALAESLAPLYQLAAAANPLLRCAPGTGDELADLTPRARARWWREHGAKLTVPIYSLVALPDASRISPVFALTHAMQTGADAMNDGEIPARAQVAPSGTLLGFVNADHLEVAVVRPRTPPWTLALAGADVPRASIVLAAIDVIAADLARKR